VCKIVCKAILSKELGFAGKVTQAKSASFPTAVVPEFKEKISAGLEVMVLLASISLNYTIKILI